MSCAERSAVALRLRLAWRSSLGGSQTDTEPDLSELHAQALLHLNFKLSRARVFRTEMEENIAGYP